MGEIVQLSLIENPKPARKTKTRLPEDWMPSEANLAYAKSKGMTERQALQQAELFLNYWLGCGKPMMDWNRVWNVWIMNSLTRYARRGGHDSKPYSPII